MNEYPFSDGFIVRALDAAVSALHTLIAGDRLPADDLIAGTMAIEWLTRKGGQPERTHEALRRLRVLLAAPGFAHADEGRAEAGRLLPMVQAIRAEQ